MQFITSLAFLALAAAGVYAQGPQINTPPSVVECQPTQLTFSGGTAPYFVSIIPGGQVGAAALENLGTLTGTTFTWLADIASGTAITFQIKDTTGATAFSAIVTVQSGSDTSCVGKNSLSSSSSGSSTGAASSTSSSGTSSAASSTTSSSASSSSSSSSKASTPSATTPTSGTSSRATTATTSGSPTTASSPAATTSNAALALNSGPAAGIIGMLLAALII